MKKEHRRIWFCIELKRHKVTLKPRDPSRWRKSFVVPITCILRILHAVSAIHALDRNAYKRHKDALANFNKNYVKTEIFPRKLGKKIAESEEIRHASDYDDFYMATKVEAEEQIQTAKELVKLVEEYVQKRWAQEE